MDVVLIVRASAGRRVYDEADAIDGVRRPPCKSVVSALYFGTCRCNSKLLRRIAARLVVVSEEIGSKQWIPR